MLPVTLKLSHSSNKEKYKFYLYVQRLQRLSYLTDVQGTVTINFKHNVYKYLCDKILEVKSSPGLPEA